MSEFIITKKEIDALVSVLQEHRHDFFATKKAYEACFARPVGAGRFFTRAEFNDAVYKYPYLSGYHPSGISEREIRTKIGEYFDEIFGEETE